MVDANSHIEPLSQLMPPSKTHYILSISIEQLPNQTKGHLLAAYQYLTLYIAIEQGQKHTSTALISFKPLCCCINQQMESSSLEHLLPTDPSIAAFQGKVSKYRFCLHLAHFACNVVVLLCGIGLFFSEFPSKCDSDLTLWLDVYCGICAFGLFLTIKQISGKETPCLACCFHSLALLEAIWVSVGLLGEENRAVCPQAVWQLVYVAVYGVKLVVWGLFCCGLCWLGGVTAHQSRIRPLTDAEIQSFQVSNQGREAELCHCCHQLISSGSQVIRLHCAQDHSFHVLCLRTYLRKRNICPKCFRRLEIGSDFH